MCVCRHQLGKRSIFILGFLKDDVLSCIKNLRFVIELCLEGFWFLLEDFLKIIFLHGEFP